MHSEWYEVPRSHAAGDRRTARARRPHRRGRHHHRAHAGILGAQPARPAATPRIFITPGFDFRVVDLLVTNFHLPKLTLLMLVSAFAGYERMHGAVPPRDRAALPLLQLRRRDAAGRATPEPHARISNCSRPRATPAAAA